MKTVQGYTVTNLNEAQIVSVEEGKKIRRRDLEADKSRVKYGFKPYVNPETYTGEEKLFMQS